MRSQGPVIESDWTRLVAPVVVLMASVVACSAIRPADAGTPSACRPGHGDQWVGRAASASIAEQARQVSGSRTVRLVMPNEAPQDAHARADRLNLYLDEQALITRTRCG